MGHRLGAVEEVVTVCPSFWRGRRVLVTGHTGFKGSWLLVWLRHLGAEVRGLALPPPAGRCLWSLLGEPGGHASLGDIRDEAAVARAFAFEPEIVLHLAAQALVRPSYAAPADTFDTNVMGLVRVLDRVRHSPSVRAVVNVTSDKCYENREQIWAYREDDPMGGWDPYSASKGCAELVTQAYRRSFFSVAETPSLASARAGNVIGGGDWSTDRLLPDCLAAFAAAVPVHIRAPGSTRPWQHVLEPLAGYLTLARALVERGDDVAEAWNFGPSDDDCWRVDQVVGHAARAWGGTAAWQVDDRPHAHEATLLRVDASKARTRLAWRPRLSVATAIDWTVEWVRAVEAGADAAATCLAQIERYSRLLDQRAANKDVVAHVA